jgi:hypothetical protein
MELLVLIMAILFRRELRRVAILVLIVLGVATWYTVSFWSERYNHWVACGRPQIGTSL